MVASCQDRMQRALEIIESNGSSKVTPASSDPQNEAYPPRPSIGNPHSSSTTLSIRNAHTSPLLRLPSHIRDEIYTHICHSGGIIYLGRSRSQRHKTLALRFLRTCRQIHAEALGCLYGINVFAITSPEDGHRLLCHGGDGDADGDGTVARLRNVRLRNVAFNDPRWHQVLNELLPQMGQLRSLEISCLYGTSQQGVLDLLRSFEVEGGRLAGKMVLLSRGLEKVTIRMAEESYREVFEDARNVSAYGLRAGGALMRQQAVRIEMEEEEAEADWR